MPMTRKTEALLSILEAQPVIPVLVIRDLSTAVPLAQALVRGGLPAIEITLRTPDAIDAIRLVCDEVEGAIVGAGTILTPKHYDKAESAGAKFIVSPGTTVELLERARDSDVPLLPGAATPSEVMSMREEGYEILKFFPAEQSGGVPYLNVDIPYATVAILNGCPLIDSGKDKINRPFLNATLRQGGITELFSKVAIHRPLQPVSVRLVAVNTSGQIPDTADGHIQLKRIERPRRRSGSVASGVGNALSRPQ